MTGALYLLILITAVRLFWDPKDRPQEPVGIHERNGP
jgi:hypothetical protein